MYRRLVLELAVLQLCFNTRYCELRACSIHLHGMQRTYVCDIIGLGRDGRSQLSIDRKRGT